MNVDLAAELELILAMVFVVLAFALGQPPKD